MDGYHIPVLLKESVEGLKIDPDGIYVDVTYGGGGHSIEILKQLKNGRLYSFDQDEDAARNLPVDQRFFFIQGNFRYLKNYLKYYGVKKIDGLLADLGVSSYHFDTAHRGFTYRTDARLDMRMNRKGKISAETVINDYDADRLSDLFFHYGEIPQARKLSAAIDKARQVKRIETTSQLSEAISPLVPYHAENQFLSKVFQAIRIEVNRELESLEKMLEASAELLNSGGRLVVISYHSLEDRMVKNFMRWGNVREEPVKDVFGRTREPFGMITRKPATPNENEIRSNPRARSARLRIAEKK